MSAFSTQVGGEHYTSMAIQPMEYSMANGLDACQHTIIKYVSRFRAKGGITDLEKARHVIDMLIEFERSKAAADPAANSAITNQERNRVCEEQLAVVRARVKAGLNHEHP